jgi:hypothetical protein
VVREAQGGELSLTTDYGDRPLFDGDQIQEIIFQWLDLIKERAEEGDGQYDELAESVDAWKLAARKSNYLSRRLHSGQKHRTEKCPVHEGHWSGYGYCDQGCSLGIYDSTGWLPEPGDEVAFGQCVVEGCENKAVTEIVYLRNHDGYKAGERRPLCQEHYR